MEGTVFAAFTETRHCRDSEVWIPHHKLYKCDRKDNVGGLGRVLKTYL